MTLGTLIARNLRRHLSRVLLTAFGIATVILAFNLIITTVRAWYGGVEASAPNRLIVRHAASLSIHLPLAYRDRLASMEGVTGVAYANWFGGVYREARGFFPQFAIDPVSFLDLHTEILVTPDEQRAFLSDRRGCLIGSRLAEQYGWHIGDVIPLKGTLYPGDWEFIVRGIYRGSEPTTDESWMLVRWDYMNERRQQQDPDRAGTVGWYVIRVADPARAGSIAGAVDAAFANSMAETRTETEQAFQMGFVAMSGAIISALKVLAVALNGITLLVLANTLVMTVRERTRELAVLRTLGFRSSHLVTLVVGEALSIAGLGSVLGMALTIPANHLYANFVEAKLGNLFPHLDWHLGVLILSASVTLLVAVCASTIPITAVLRANVARDLRHIG
ncbi:ABC transporter ATP-binding protein [Nitrospira sp. KM1]|uniref:ABC transporter permease n=1 Tax=Nitrospira sp. KM1 TaxID=1936990 RepID=UPI0013A74551|nr:FtsX-like permease family protein [Nitrospira sp. KM1]BCA56661.1 ABC transporter ATP-binding protein [Nitrospira sp. KM1]